MTIFHFLALGVLRQPTAGDAIGINYFKDMARGLETELWDLGGPHYIASILSSFKIWDLGGSLLSAVLFRLPSHRHLENKVIL